MNGSTNPSAVRSKKEISEALLRLMEQHPYDEITVKQIALEAKLVRKTFYRNFTSKDDVLDSILGAMLTEYTEELVREKGRSTPEIIFGFCLRNKRIITLLDKNDMMYRVLNKLNDALPARHDELDALGLIPEEYFGDLDMTYILPLNIGAAWNVICKWIRGGMRDDPKVITETIRSYIARIGRLAAESQR